MRSGYASDNEYPTENLRKAEVRVNKIKKWLEMLGYKVTVFDISDPENIDMIAENIYVVIGLEITNWNENSYLNIGKLNGYKRHWKKLERELRAKGDKRTFRKRLIYSYYHNVEFMLRYLEIEHVELEEIGYQDIPIEKKEEPKQVIGWKD